MRAEIQLTTDLFSTPPTRTLGGSYFLATEEKFCGMSLARFPHLVGSSRLAILVSGRIEPINTEETMGYDLYANRGAYLRHSNLSGCVLWGFVKKHCNDLLTPEDFDSTGRVLGYAIDGDRAVALADRIEDALSQGAAPKQGPDPLFSIEQDIRDFAAFCRDSGGFEIC